MEAAEDVEELHAEDCFRTWQFWKVCFLIFTMAIAREAQKFLIPLIGAESGLHTSFVGHVAFMSQMESLVAAPVGGFFMESLGIFPVVLVSLLLSAVGIQFLCMHGIRFYVQGASLLGLGCGLCAGAAIALSIVYAPEGPPSRKRSFLNGSRFCNSSADVLVPLVVGLVVSSWGTWLVGTSLALCTLCSVAAALISFPLSDSLHRGEPAESVLVPEMDFVIPLKAAGPFTRTVLEAIHVNYAPRKIHIICKHGVREAMSKIMVEWSLPRGKVAFVDEETYFQKVMGLNREDLKANFKGVGPRDFGWWWQQLLKLGAGQCIEGISENFCVWDADLIVLEPWPLLQKETCFVAPLQENYLSARHQEAYEASTKHILNMEPTNPPKGGTWIAHHMVFQKRVLFDLLELIASHQGHQGPWPLKLLKMAETFERMSEYVLYGTYASRFKGVLSAHPFKAHGARGLRLYGKEEAARKGRDSSEFLMQSLNAEGVPYSGHSYERVATEVSSLQLTHLQMEHVYEVRFASGCPAVQ